MSKGKGQQVTENNLFPLEFQVPDRKDTLQTAKNVINLKEGNYKNIHFQLSQLVLCRLDNLDEKSSIDMININDANIFYVSISSMNRGTKLAIRHEHLGTRSIDPICCKLIILLYANIFERTDIFCTLYTVLIRKRCRIR